MDSLAGIVTMYVLQLNPDLYPYFNLTFPIFADLLVHLPSKRQFTSACKVLFDLFIVRVLTNCSNELISKGIYPANQEN